MSLFSKLISITKTPYSPFLCRKPNYAVNIPISACLSISLGLRAIPRNVLYSILILQ